jgi:uncharacterized protein YaeQ
MAINATIRKAHLQIADMDRHVYLDHAVTVAQHPSETDERVMVRLLALALNVPPASDENGPLALAKSLWDPDEPDLWQKDLTGSILHWIDLGQPDERRLTRASGRADRVSVYTHLSSTAVWWKGLGNKVNRLRNLRVWEIPSAESQALTALCQRSMALQVTVQDGHVWITDGQTSCEVVPVLLKAEAGLATV